MLLYISENVIDVVPLERLLWYIKQSNSNAVAFRIAKPTFEMGKPIDEVMKKINFSVYHSY